MLLDCCSQWTPLIRDVGCQLQEVTLGNLSRNVTYWKDRQLTAWTDGKEPRCCGSRQGQAEQRWLLGDHHLGATGGSGHSTQLPWTGLGRGTHGSSSVAPGLCVTPSSLMIRAAALDSKPQTQRPSLAAWNGKRPCIHLFL